jgi:putative ABC transport system permease protein
MWKLPVDLLHARRSLLRRRAYFVTASATLALVLGANAAIFAVVSATLLRPLPFAAGDRVVQLFMMPPGMTDPSQRNPPLQMDLVRLRERARTMKRIEGFLRGDRVVLHGAEPAAVPGAAITPGLIDMMQVRMAAGRGFQAEEGEPGHDVFLVTGGYWRRALGSPAIGTSIVVDGRPHTLVGVLADGFPPNVIEGEVFVPLVANAVPAPRNISRYVVSFAELADRASADDANRETQAIARQLAQEFPQTHNGWTGGAQPAREWLYGQVRAPILMLFAATAFVLLIACANLANLTAAHATARAGDFSLRVALGASRFDVLRLQFAELLILSIAGLVPGLLLAWVAVPALLAIDPVAARTLGAVQVDWRVQAFSAAAALLTAIGAAIVPSIRSFAGGTAARLADRTPRTAGSRTTARVRRMLLIAEVGLCLALLMAGAVVIGGLRAITRQHPGFDPHGVLTAQVRLPDAGYSTHPARVAFVSTLLDRVRVIPGVEAASTTMNDFTPGFAYQTQFRVENRPTPDGQPHSTQFRRVSPDYFRTMRIRELHGRTFTSQDTPDSPAVAVVSRSLADQLFPGEDVIGRVLRRNAPNAPPIAIIGVVDDVYDVGMGQAPGATLYLPWSQTSNTGVPISLVIRTELEPLSLAPAVRQALAALDPSLPLRKVQPLDTFLEESLAPERFRTTVLGTIVALGLGLAALGIYGVTYRGVVDRTREFAIRLALGSERQGVVRMVVAEAFEDVAAGALAGMIVGALVCTALARLVPNVAATSTASVAASVAVLMACAMAAAVIPALRVLRVDPAEALRVQ